LARLERIAYRAGLSPRDFHALSLSRLMRVCISHMEQEKAEWRRTATIGSFVINYGGLSAPDSAVEPQEVLPHAFPNAEASRGMTRERYEQNLQQHYKRLRREQAKKQRNADPTID
jgi:hypothetical protein